MIIIEKRMRPRYEFQFYKTLLKDISNSEVTVKSLEIQSFKAIITENSVTALYFYKVESLL